MKKIISLLLILSVTLFGVTACGEETKKKNSGTSGEKKQTETKQLSGKHHA